MLTAEESHCLIPLEVPTWRAAERFSAFDKQVARARSHCAPVGLAWQGSGVNTVNMLFLLSVFFPLSKSAPGRKCFNLHERSAVYPSTASRNHLPPEWFPHELKRWLNTSFFVKWNSLQLHYSRHSLERRQHCWAITWQPGRKRGENKSKTEYIDWGVRPKVKWKRAAGSSQHWQQVATCSRFLPACPGACCSVCKSVRAKAKDRSQYDHRRCSESSWGEREPYCPQQGW